MWKCPVCDQDNNDDAVTVCPACGYDRTRSHERHARQAKARPITVLLTPDEAAAGCEKTVTFKSGKKRVRLTLPIPAGMIYGEKLYYPLAKAGDGTRHDVTIRIMLCKSRILWNLFLHLAALATIAMGLSLCALLLSLVIGIFGGSFISPAGALNLLLGSAVCYAIFGGPVLIRESMYKKKYGPHTLMENTRCEVPRIILLELDDLM